MKAEGTHLGPRNECFALFSIQAPAAEVTSANNGLPKACGSSHWSIGKNCFCSDIAQAYGKCFRRHRRVPCMCPGGWDKSSRGQEPGWLPACCLDSAVCLRPRISCAGALSSPVFYVKHQIR